MGKVKIADNTIWLKHIERDIPLQERLRALRPGETVDLEVAGIVGRWARMKDGRDGRPTEGIKPLDEMREVWKTLQKHRGRVVDVRQVESGGAHLASLGATLDEWNSPEDEEAFRDL